MNLRDYQLAAHDAVMREWGFEPWWDGERPTSDSTAAIMATAGGKTIVAAKMAQTLLQMGKRVLFVGDREELILQPVEKFYKAARITAAIHRGSQSASPHADVVVGSIQTLSRRLPPGRPFDIIIDDEAHRNTDTRAKIHEAYPGAKILGITATPYRKNLADLSQWYKTVAFELGTFDLIGQGYLTPIQVLTLPLEVDLTQVHQSNGDFDQKEVSQILEPYYVAVANAIKQHAADRTILAFLPLIQSSKDFCAVMRQEGLTARHCDGQSEDRKEIMEQFENGEFQILSNSQVFSTGVDFIKCDCMLNLAATRSRAEYRQRAGRIMRLIPGTIDPGGVTLPTAEERRAAIAASSKPTALILDLLWQTEKIGLAGPACIIAASDEEEEIFAERIKRQRTPEELLEMRAQVQAAKEEELRKMLERAAGKGGSLRDAREIIVALHQTELIDYQPGLEWEGKPVSETQVKKLRSAGYSAKGLQYRGQASKLIDEAIYREENGMAPLETFPALLEAGVAHPEKVTLNKAIQVLGDRFPCTYGAKHKGVPLRDVPRHYWQWLWLGHDVSSKKARKTVERHHPSVYRYLTRVVFKQNRPQQERMSLT